MGQCCPSTPEDETKSVNCPTQNRWFWSTEKELTQTSHWVQYPLYLSDQIEKVYQEKHSQFNYDQHVIKFDRNTNKHMEFHYREPKGRLIVKREFPKKIKNFFRTGEDEMTAGLSFKPYQPSPIDNLRIFYYSQVFDYFRVDTSSSFISSFSSSFAIMNDELIHFLSTDFISYLEEFHNLKRGSLFTFSTLKEILVNDFSRDDQSQSLFPYVDYYVKDLSEENFNKVVVRMYAEEGDLRKTLSNVIESMSYKSNMSCIFYYICLLFAFENRNEKITNDITVYRGTSIQENVYDQYQNETYIKGNIIINNGFVSTTKNIERALSMMKERVNYKKVLLELRIEREDNEDSFLTFKPYDMEKISQYNEQEILLPSNGVFQVVDFDKSKEECTLIKLHYKTNLFCECLPFIINDKDLMKKKFGVYDSELNAEEYKYALSLKFTNGKINGIDQMLQLQQLDLKGNTLGVREMKELSKIVQSLPNLHKLDLGNTQIGIEGIKEFEQIKNSTKLEYLNLECNDLNEEGIIAFSEQLFKFPQLRTLKLKKNFRGIDGIIALSNNMQYLSNLQYLDLSYNGIKVEGMKSFCSALPNFSNLYELNLSLNEFGNDGMQILSEHMHYLITIRNIISSQSAFGDEGMKAFAMQLKHVPNLQQVDFRENTISDDGVKAFAEQVQYIPNFRMLDLRENRVSDEGIEALLSALKSSNTPWTNKCSLFQLCENEQKEADKVLFCYKFVLKMEEFPDKKLELKQINNVALFGNFSYYKNVEVMSLIENQIGDECVFAFSVHLYLLQNLMELNIIKIDLQNQALKAFSEQLYQLKNLRKLNLIQNKLGEEGMKILSKKFQVLQTLVELDIEDNYIGPNGILFFLEAAAYLKRIQKLNLKNNLIGEVGMKALCENLYQFPDIQMLILSMNAIGDEGMKAFSVQIHHLPKLYRLDLAGNQIGDAGIIAFSEQINLQNNLTILEDLHIGNNEISETGIKAFSAKLQFLPKLRWLDLSHNPIKDEGLEIFSANLEHLSNLEQLHLSAIQIGNEGIKAFSEGLHHLSKLQWLALDGNTIGDDYMKTLSQQLGKLTHLLFLDLTQNKIREEGKRAFLGESSRLPKLKRKCSF